MDTQDNNKTKKSDMESTPDDDLQATTARLGKRKLLPAYTDSLPVIDRDDAGSFKDVMSELKNFGVPCVPLAASADVIHFGVALDESWGLDRPTTAGTTRSLDGSGL